MGTTNKVNLEHKQQQAQQAILNQINGNNGRFTVLHDIVSLED